MTEEQVREAQNNYKKEDTKATSFLQHIVSRDADHYNEGGGMNPIFRKVGAQVPEDIKSKIEEINRKEDKSQEDKRKRNDQYSRLESWRRDRIKDKAQIRQLVDAVSNDMINYELMHPEYKVLLAQLVDKNVDASKKGIELFHDENDVLKVKYSKDRMKKEEESVRGEGLSEEGEKETVSFQDLLNSVHYKNVDVENSIYTIITGQAEEAGLMYNISKNFVIKDWEGDNPNSGKSKVRKALTPIIKGGPIISDIATRDIFGKGSTYRDDLTFFVENMDLSRFGLIDKGKPGYQDDLAKNALIKEEIIGRLINPKTPEDLKFAEENMLEYMLDMAGQAFNSARSEFTKDDDLDLEEQKEKTVEDYLNEIE